MKYLFYSTIAVVVAILMWADVAYWTEMVNLPDSALLWMNGRFNGYAQMVMWLLVFNGMGYFVMWIVYEMYKDIKG